MHLGWSQEILLTNGNPTSICSIKMWHHSQKIYHVYQVISNYSQRMPTHDKYNNVCHTIITLFPDNMCVPWYSHNVYWQCGSICSILNEDYCTMLYLMKILVIIVWLVVWNIRSFSIHWEFHHPNWRSHIFQRGRLNHQPDAINIPIRSY